MTYKGMKAIYRPHMPRDTGKVQPIFRLHLNLSITPKFALPGGRAPLPPAPHGAGTHRQIGTCGAVTGVFPGYVF